MRLRGTRLGLLLLAACALSAPACGPKGRTDSGGAGGGSATPEARVPWADEAKQLLEYGLAGPRVFWNEPAMRPGERVRWLITARSFPDRFLDVSRDAGTDRWTLVSGHPSSPRRTLVATMGADGRVATLAISGKDLPLSETRRAADLEAIVPAAIAGTAGEAGFAGIGGRFLGNEVLRVPAGEFRARHATVPGAHGAVWHLYLVRTVPGGIAKVEMFKSGAIDPALVMELDDSTRLPKQR